MKDGALSPRATPSTPPAATKLVPVDLRRKHGRRKLLAKDVPAYIQQLEDTIDRLRGELTLFAGRTAEAAKDGYERGHAEGRQYERAMRR